MGFFQTIAQMFSGGGRTAEVLVLGLDNSGKTTILNQLKPPDQQSNALAPTVGFNVEKFAAAGITFTAYDMSGQTKYRNLWETHFKRCNAIIFVVDSTDRLRMAVARDEFWMVLDHKDVKARKVPILIFANKSDEKLAMSATEMNISLGLDVIREHNWNLVQSCALTGQGLVAGISWLADEVKQAERESA